MVLHLTEYDDLYIKQLRISIGHAIIRVPCPPNGYCNDTCGLRPFCILLKHVYSEVCEEESKRNGTKA